MRRKKDKKIVKKRLGL